MHVRYILSTNDRRWVQKDAIFYTVIQIFQLQHCWLQDSCARCLSTTKYCVFCLYTFWTSQYGHKNVKSYFHELRKNISILIQLLILQSWSSTVFEITLFALCSKKHTTQSIKIISACNTSKDQPVNKICVSLFYLGLASF